MSDISAWFSVWSGVFLVVLCGCPSSNSGGQARESEKQMVVEKLVPSTVEILIFGDADAAWLKSKLDTGTELFNRCINSPLVIEHSREPVGPSPSTLPPDWEIRFTLSDDSQVLLEIDGNVAWLKRENDWACHDIKKPVSYTHLTLPTTPYV